LSNSTLIHAVALGALCLGASALAPSAQAQSCGDPAPIVHSSYPADGATGVPTNAPLVLYGPELGSDTEIALSDESGAAASIDVQAVDGGVLVDAFLGLEASTTYELTVSAAGGGDEWSASFTTGTGPATPVQLRAPDVTVSVVEQDRGSCGVVSAICVIGSVSASRTLEVSVGDEVMSLGGGEPGPAFPASGGAVGASACIEVRVREPGGSVSQPTRLCGAELSRFELAANAAAPTSCRAYAPAAEDDEEESSSESGGCALSAPGAASGLGGLSLGLAALLTARRRMARRWLSVRRR
jgi:hypothetical protein